MLSDDNKSNLVRGILMSLYSMCATEEVEIPDPVIESHDFNNLVDHLVLELNKFGVYDDLLGMDIESQSYLLIPLIYEWQPSYTIDEYNVEVGTLLTDISDVDVSRRAYAIPIRIKGDLVEIVISYPECFRRRVLNINLLRNVFYPISSSVNEHKSELWIRISYNKESLREQSDLIESIETILF